MENSHLHQLVQSLSPIERREARKFLLSPFFNQRTDLVELYDWLTERAEPVREEAWRRLFGPQPYDDQKLRLLMSYLHRMLEQYVSIKEWGADPLGADLSLLTAYRKRALPGAFERAQKSLEKSLEAQPLRNSYYHDSRFKLQWEAHQLTYARTPTEGSALRQLMREADILYLSQKLRLICLFTAHQAVYQTDGGADIDETTIALAERPDMADVPAVAMYLHCYRMLRYPESEAHFLKFKNLLLEQSERFLAEEMHGLYILAINYCVRRLNAGHLHYFHEVLDLYKAGLEKGYLLENGALSRFTYHNVVAAGLHVGELDWVDYFIHHYKNSLEKRYRESSFSFNLARLEYARHRHGSVLELLQKANYRDPLLNLAAKTLLLKTYFDLNEYDLLQSHLDAMRNYIHRKRVIGYHRTNYLNIIRYTEKMIRLDPYDKKAAARLWEAVSQEEVLTEKGFFQKALGG